MEQGQVKSEYVDSQSEGCGDESDSRFRLVLSGEISISRGKRLLYSAFEVL